MKKNIIASLILILASTSIYAEQKVTPQQIAPSTINNTLPTNIQQQEIKEFIWFNCSVCASLNKHVANWDDRTDNAYVNYIPVVWDFETEQEAKIIHAFKIIAKKNNLNMSNLLDELFELKILEHKKMSILNISSILNKNNISKEEFLKVINSPATLFAVNDYKRLTKEFEIETVPTFIINNEKISRGDVKTNSDLFILFNKKIN